LALLAGQQGRIEGKFHEADLGHLAASVVKEETGAWRAESGGLNQQEHLIGVVEMGQRQREVVFVEAKLSPGVGEVIAHQQSCVADRRKMGKGGRHAAGGGLEIENLRGAVHCPTEQKTLFGGIFSQWKVLAQPTDHIQREVNPYRSSRKPPYIGTQSFIRTQ